eukprot:g12774.t1
MAPIEANKTRRRATHLPASAQSKCPSGGEAERRQTAAEEDEEENNLWSSILSEVSTRSRSKLPSGKAVLVTGKSSGLFVLPSTKRE